jgi:hypothetical protein
MAIDAQSVKGVGRIVMMMVLIVVVVAVAVVASLPH